MDLKARSGLTPGQYAVLLALSRVPDSDQRTVGELTSLDKSTVSDVAGRLVREHLLEKHPDLADGRRWVLRATPRAIQIVEAQVPHLRAVDELFLAPLTPRQRHALLTNLRRIAFADRPDPAHHTFRESGDAFSVQEVAWAFGRLVRICHQRHTALWARAAGEKLTPVQYSVLIALGELDRIDQRTLGNLVYLDKASSAELVRRLHQRGLVTWMADNDDGRRKLLSLAPEAERVLSTVRWPTERVREQLLESVPPSSRRNLIRSLQVVIEGQVEGSG